MFFRNSSRPFGPFQVIFIPSIPPQIFQKKESTYITCCTVTKGTSVHFAYKSKLCSSSLISLLQSDTTVTALPQGASTSVDAHMAGTTAKQPSSPAIQNHKLRHNSNVLVIMCSIPFLYHCFQNTERLHSSHSFTHTPHLISPYFFLL